MVIKKFKGRSHNEALAKAKIELGTDITLLHTRTLNTILGSSKVEVTVTTEPPKRLRGRNRPLESRPDPTFLKRQQDLTALARKTIGQARDEIQQPTRRRTDQVAKPSADGRPSLHQLEKLQQRNRAQVMPQSIIKKVPLGASAAPITPVAPVPPASSTPLVSPRAVSPAPAPAAFTPPVSVSRQQPQAPAGKGVQDDVSEMKKMLKELISMQRKDRFGDIPDELSEFYVKLIEQEVVEDLAHGLVKRLVTEVGKDFLNDKELLREKLLTNIAKLINVGSPITLKKGQTRVVAMIGPTGVGKTTTIAKLAANLQLKQKAKVGLITLDTFRIAAVDQLHNYASILDVPIVVVNRAEEILEAIIQLSTCDVILIDTAGRSHRDYDKMSDLANFLDLAKPDEVHLVLSTTTSQKSMERIIDSFSYCHIDRILLTKLDEAVNLGMVLNVLGRVQTELSYFTMGQNVPDDIEEGEARTLARMILT